MASAQHAAQHPRYPLNTYSNSDSLRLPSLKDLNFYRPPPGDPNAPPNDFVQNDVARHVQWSRPGQSAPMQPGMPPHSQHAQPQSQPQPQQHSPNSRDMGHQAVEYSKHDAVYARPGMPLSAQVAPVPGSVSSGPAARGDDPPPQSPHQPRRPRPPPANINAARDGRPSHTAYPAQYNGYPSNQPPSSSPYHQMPSQNHSPHSAAPSQPEQLNHNAPAASSHPNYNGYSQQHYIQTRQPGHPSHAPQHPQAYHQQSLQHQNTSHPTPPSHHAIHVHPSQQQQQQQQQQHQQQQQQQQQQHQQQPTASSNPPSVHPSSLLQPPHPSQQAPHHTSHHQPSSVSHQPQQQQLPNHAPHGNPYPSPNSSVHPPQSPWPPSSHSQPPHHQPLPAPSHAQQTQQALSQSVHHHHPPPPVPSHHHHQTNALPPSTPQAIIQSQHQHAPPPQSLPPSQTQHHPPQHSQAQAPNPHHASQPQLPQSQPHPPPQQQQLPFTRTAPLVPTNLDSRNAHYPPAASSAPEIKHVPDHSDPMNEIVEHCNSLCMFAQHYAAAAQQSMQPSQPSPAELQDMSQKALQVVRLLEGFKRAHVPDSERNKLGDSMYEASEDHRAPKRPWEDMAQGGNNADSPEGQYALGADKGQTTAEQDMEIIRSKRASSTAGANTTAGQTKSKYRKRSRATPPGKCHSCNIRETPEWRRGPDGARTLCNACGLHYAKLMRKRDKTDPTGQTPRIDLETLRASARAAESSDKSRSKHKNAAEPSSPTDSKSSSQQHHQGSFQLMNVMTQEPNSSSESNRTIPPPQASQPPPPAAQSAPSTIPVPPWSTPVQSQPPSSVAGPPSVHGRGYPEHLQHQSFMRSSQHSSAPQASSR